ncbi:MAG: cytochrome P460 family protein [Desulfuromonadaceae bacterium]|nr:cytochrome P460 family protein [Desulfuromonadaceae bacterium]
MKSTVVLFSVLFLCIIAAVSGAASTALPKGYTSWKKSDRKVVTDKNSLFYGIHYIYADKKAQIGYLSVNRFAEGSRIVVESYTIKGNPAIDGPKNMIVLMKKDKRQTATGGWLFAGFGVDGKPSGLDPVTTCFGCHKKDAAQKDYVISTKKDFRF